MVLDRVGELREKNRELREKNRRKKKKVVKAKSTRALKKLHEEKVELKKILAPPPPRPKTPKELIGKEKAAKARAQRLQEALDKERIQEQKLHKKEKKQAHELKEATFRMGKKLKRATTRVGQLKRKMDTWSWVGKPIPTVPLQTLKPNPAASSVTASTGPVRSARAVRTYLKKEVSPYSSVLKEIRGKDKAKGGSSESEYRKL